MGVMWDISAPQVSRVLGKRFQRSRTKSGGRVKGTIVTSSGFKVTSPSLASLERGEKVYVERVPYSPDEDVSIDLEQYATVLRQAGYVAVIEGNRVVVTHVVEKEN